MLNEIILTLKDAKDEVRKVAYDAILTISSAFRNSLCAGSSEPYHQLITMNEELWALLNFLWISANGLTNHSRVMVKIQLLKHSGHLLTIIGSSLVS
ncbi:uncharacterized protein [Euphorbia lathyris]|uniref:uncharacterized protein isoform X2 n=1 Tax=Euphorbia lathyris TaxID=212925 RepID=UPI0033144C33